MINITRNPKHIGDIHDKRTASYKGGIASPADWYWRHKRGDKKIAKEMGYKTKDISRMNGWKIGADRKIAMVCDVNGYYYCV